MATNIYPMASETKSINAWGSIDVKRIRAATADVLLSIVILFGIAIAVGFAALLVLPWLVKDSGKGH